MDKRDLIKWALLSVSMITALAWGQNQSKLLSHEIEIDNIIKSMTLEEKIDMLHGKKLTGRSASVRRWNRTRGTPPT